jgi:hypothetical protein
MSETLYAALLWTVLAAGLVAAVAYLAIHRPRQWWRAATLNADGWVIIAALWYARSMIVLAMRGAAYRTPVDAAVALGMLLLIDVMVIYRVVSFVRFRRTYRAASKEDSR